MLRDEGKMLQSLAIKNFKVLKEFEFQLSNLTLLSGLNSMGKSSLIQVLLLIRQSHQQKVLNKDGLLLSGNYLNIGNGKDALCIDAEEDTIAFGMEWDDHKFLNLHFNYNGGSNLQTLKKVEPLNFNFEKSLFNNCFQYLSAERVSPKSVFPVSDYDINTLHSLGKNGEFTAHFLFEHGNKPITVKKLQHNKARSDSLIAQVDAWMSDISPGIKITANVIPEVNQASLRYEFETKNGFTEKFRPENVGFGLTYVLPVVTAVLAASPGDLLIFENPEAHLHPAGQSAVANLLATAAQSGIQIIIETHSDHFLNGVRIATKKANIDHDNISIFYFSPQQHSSEHAIIINQPFIDDSGMLDEWPDGFFDEWDKGLDILID